MGSGDDQARAGQDSAERAVEGPESVPPPTLDLTAAAFFDVDNTLVQGSSLVHFGRGLAARKYFRYSEVWKFIYAQAKFQLTGRENSDDVAEGRRKALAFIEGRTTAELRTLGEEIYDEIIADKIWPGTRALAQTHLDAGQQVWLVTATPSELAETIARRLGLTGALGTVAESVDGVFTGRLVGDILHGSCGACAGHPGGPKPQTVHRLFRQLQRRPDALAGGYRGGDQPGCRSSRTGPGEGLGNPGFPHRPQGRQDRGALGAGLGRGRRRRCRGRLAPP